jgi:hypothetical protein
MFYLWRSAIQLCMTSKHCKLLTMVTKVIASSVLQRGAALDTAYLDFRGISPENMASLCSSTSSSSGSSRSVATTPAVENCIETGAPSLATSIRQMSNNLGKDRNSAARLHLLEPTLTCVCTYYFIRLSFSCLN